LLVLLFAFLTHQHQAAGQDTVADQARLDFFESRIRPVLIEHCYECHAADARNIRGGLLLDSVEGSRAGGESGPAVVPGKPEESLLLSAIRYESFEMPPDQRLDESIVRDFEQWIREGAVDPRVGGVVHKAESVDLDEGREFWSFQPIVRPSIPESEGQWARTPIDHFIAARHRIAQVTAAEDAAPEVLLRRLYFVLIGLPPSYEQVETFVSDYSRDPDLAVQQTVDQLLESPQFGERWGRHWLDVARFAESSGGGRSLMFPDAWRFRDYVIRAFNEDRPFDQMVREHVAGDLLEAADDQTHDQNVTGSGYLVLGPINYEEQDKELLRMNVVDEQIDSLGRTFLGMTLGCARCHDHKFDPIPTADYYALAGVLRSTQTLTPGNVSGYVTTALQSGVDGKAVTAWNSQLEDLQRQIQELKSAIGDRDTRGIAIPTLPGIVVDDSQAEFDGEWSVSQFNPPYVGAGYHHSGHSKTGRTARFETMLPESGIYSVRICYNWQSSRSGDVPVRIRHANGEDVVHLDQQKPATIAGAFHELGQFQFAADQPAVVILDAENSSAGYVIADAVQFVPKADAKQAAQLTATEKAELSEMQKELKSLEDRLKQHKKKEPKVPVVMSVRDDATPQDWHIHVRGEIRNLGESVPRGFLRAATPSLWVSSDGLTDVWDIPADQSGRRQLAEWLVNRENPLTTRVFVNRVWLHVMGDGIVRSPDNFGRTGRKPTHPELLDYLAGTFVDADHWSVKSLIRRLCVSRTFRLASTPSAQAAIEDPDNELLTHARRRPLDAECLRDAMLMASGELDLTIHGGRTIGKLSTYDNSYDHSEFNFRGRSVYVPVLRNSMLDLFGIFNVANPNLVTGQRNRSVLPAQALYLLNSAFVMEQAEKTAHSFLEEHRDVDDPEVLIREACRRVLSRDATADEIARIHAYLRTTDTVSPEAWTTVFHSLFASIDFRYLD